MPTLQAVTLAHSQRLSEIYRTRDVRMAQAQLLRDTELRSLPAAAKIYAQYDNQLLASREKQTATDSKAEAMRHSSLLAVGDHRSGELEDAQIARRAADIDAVERKRLAEDIVAKKYHAAIAGLRELPFNSRDKAAQDAERARRSGLDEARRAHDEALAASQKAYRDAVDAALLDERRDGRDAERAYFDALRLGDTAMRAAKSSADQNLAAALARVPDAAEVLRSWRAALATIARETAEAEQEAFARFRRDLDSLKV